MKNSTLLHGRVINAMKRFIRREGRSLAFTMFLLSFTLGVMANPVGIGRARQVATTFLNNNGARSAGLTDVSAMAGFSNVYVFTTENSFVLMAADDRVQPILGYSLTGRFDVENMPANKRAWIREYNYGIQYAIDNQLRASSEVAQQWQDLAEGNFDVGRAITVVAPLIQTQWDQVSPYNMLCPSNSVTGCVATAMAQVMKYWNYPAHGIGSHSYTPYSHPEYGEQFADFQSTNYDWNNMLNTYSGSSTYIQKLAVATLMYHCGVSVDMNYSPNGSGAGNAIVAEALKTYFNYSSDVVYHGRSDYDDNTWINMLKADLNLNRPIWYCGSGSGGGHAFVFDGYNNNNYFHVNWGWGGYCDEYYSINNMNPGPGGTGSGSNGIYNDYQGAIFGIHPSDCTANAPSNLTYTQNGRNVTLSWSAASGASSYKVYRNNGFIGNASSTSYSDTAPYGSSVYYVRSVDSQGRLSLSSNAVTVTVDYQIPVVDDLAASVSGSNVNLTWTAPDWCYPATPTATMTYGSGNYDGNLGYNGSNTIYWGHRYLASDLSNYNNMKVYKVSFYANETGSYKVYVYKGTTSNRPQTQLLQQSFTVGTEGWFDIDLSTPIQIDASQDLWVFIYDPEYRNYPATYCEYSGSEGNYYSTNPTSWIGNWDNAAFLIRTYISDGTYTYNVYRNGSCIANSVTNTNYHDNNLANGVYNYYVKTNYYAGETNASNQVSVQIGSGTYYTISASASPTEGGTVTGAGSYLAGQTCTLTATANTGYSFTNWTKNGMSVSTNATYSFTVAGNASYVANFTAITPPSPPSQVFAEYYPDANNPNSPYVKVYWETEILDDNFSIDFEDGLPADWTVIDDNNDGYTWTLTSDIPTTWTYYSGSTLDWYHNGSNAICSGSYINGVGAITPDDYLVSPQVILGNGSQLSFWAVATDPNYAADHFGVFVSTTGTNPSDFQCVQEWTMTAKSGSKTGEARESRDGKGLRLGTWYYYTVDLSAYSGQAYIAFRHFNCTDQYVLCIDDISLTSTRADRSAYCVYRANCDGSEMQLIADNVIETQYIDTEWSALAQGNYKYGVSMTSNGREGAVHWVEPGSVNTQGRQPLTPEEAEAMGMEICHTSSDNSSTSGSREMWDLLANFECTSGYQYGVATDGNYIYTSSWSASSTSQFYKYDMDGNFIEEFNVSGSGQIRDMTYDGQYFYGVANSSTVYCLDLANHNLISTFTSAYGAMRCCSYDPVRDGFWVVGNWSGNLTLIDRTGAIQFTGPAPTSASGVAYYKDDNNVEHVYCFNNGDCQIYDYDIATNTIASSPVFNFSTTPGYNSGSSGGCHIGNYGNKVAFFGDLQQSPNIIGIYELGEGQILWSNCIEKMVTAQTTELEAGWNWFSTNVDITLDDLKAALVATGNTSITIKSRNQNISYAGGRWRGNLDFDVALMYKIYVSTACEITLQGSHLNPTEHPITIKNGPNWIGFPLTESMTLNNAFAGFAVNGDVIKHKGGSAKYSNGQWRGAFNLEPGKGYIYTSGVAGNRTLTFPASAK